MISVITISSPNYTIIPFMATYLTKEKQDEIFTQYAGSATNTGSTEGQIALFSFRISSISKHLEQNKKDKASQRSLLTMVGKRKALLRYLAKSDINKYRALIQQLGIRDVLNR